MVLTADLGPATITGTGVDDCVLTPSFVEARVLCFPNGQTTGDMDTTSGETVQVMNISPTTTFPAMSGTDCIPYAAHREFKSGVFQVIGGGEGGGDTNVDDLRDCVCQLITYLQGQFPGDDDLATVSRGCQCTQPCDLCPNGVGPASATLTMSGWTVSANPSLWEGAPGNTCTAADLVTWLSGSHTFVFDGCNPEPVTLDCGGIQVRLALARTFGNTGWHLELQSAGPLGFSGFFTDSFGSICDPTGDPLVWTDLGIGVTSGNPVASANVTSSIVAN